jgi:hypothetical protein
MRARLTYRHSAWFGLVAAGVLSSTAIPIGVGDLSHNQPTVEGKKGKCERSLKVAPATVQKKATAVQQRQAAKGDRGFRLFRFLL